MSFLYLVFVGFVGYHKIDHVSDRNIVINLFIPTLQFSWIMKTSLKMNSTYRHLIKRGMSHSCFCGDVTIKEKSGNLAHLNM